MNLNNLTDRQFAIMWQKMVEKIKEDPINNFIKAKGFIDFTPTPAQIVFLKIVFNKELDYFTKHKVYNEILDSESKFDLIYEEMTEVEIYKYLTGREYKLNDDTIINMIDLIIGRRGGKTTISAMLAIYCAVINDWSMFLRKTPFATVLILSHSKEFSDEVLELIRTMIEASPILTKLINKKKKNSMSTMNLRTPWIVDKKIRWSRVQIKVGAASSKTTRGVAACAVLCDEIAYWSIDENLKETDEKIMRAVRPAMKQFGRSGLMIKLSSPGIKSGVLYGEYEKWLDHKLPSNYAVFKCPSWVFNTILPKQEFIDEWVLDQESFDIEYRANFTDSLSNFIIPEFVDMAVLKGVSFCPPESDGAKWTYKAAIDAAFKGDRFTFSVVGYSGNRIKQFVSMGWEGSRQKPVNSNEVAKYIRQVCKEYDIAMVAADQYSFNPLREIFEQYGVILEEYTFSPSFKKKIYFNLKKLIHSQQLDLLDNPIQTKEMKELIVEQTSAGSVKIGHPSGGSDDFADSMAIASFLLTEEIGSGQLEANFKMAAQIHNVKMSTTGRCFTAPPPELLSQEFGQNINDNSHMFTKHPETGKLVKKEDLEDFADDGIHVVF